jgi:16S rRNA U1498 N3-methylase RsmE
MIDYVDFFLGMSTIYSAIVTYRLMSALRLRRETEERLRSLEQSFRRDMMEVIELATVDQLLNEILRRSYTKLIMISPSRNNEKDELQIHSNLGKEVVSHILEVAKHLVDQQIKPPSDEIPPG